MNNVDQSHHYTPPLHTIDKGTSGYRVNKTTVYRRVVQLVAIVLAILAVAVLARVFSWALDNEPMYNSDTTVISSYTPASEWVVEPVRPYRQSYAVVPLSAPAPQEVPVVVGLTYEEDILARIINSEARGESYEGMVYTGNVVLNRKDHWNTAKFGGPTLEGVILMDSQFQGAGTKEWWTMKLNPDCIKAAKELLGGNRPLDLKILYFSNPGQSTVKGFYIPMFTEGNHVFGIEGGK